MPGVTPVRAVHLLELRARIDGLRARLPAFAWTDPEIVPRGDARPGAEKRVALVARDIVQHFESRQEAMDGRCSRLTGDHGRPAGPPALAGVTLAGLLGSDNPRSVDFPRGLIGGATAGRLRHVPAGAPAAGYFAAFFLRSAQ